MWDTSKDYRILVANHAREQCLNIIQTASFRGNWNKKLAIETAKNMNSDFQSLSYSYLEGDDLVNSPDVASIIEKTMENVAKVRFFIDSVLGLKDRLALGPINDPIIGIDIKVGEIMSVTKHPNADSLMICNVNLGKRAITVVTNDLNVKEGNSVGVSLLPPQSFMETTSEGMFLGMDGNILKEVEGELGEMPKGIPMDSLNETRNLVEAFLK